MKKLNKPISIILIILMIVGTFSVVSGIAVPHDCNHLCEPICLEDENYEYEYICEHSCEYICVCVEQAEPDEPDDIDDSDVPDISDTLEELDETECGICPPSMCECVQCDEDCDCVLCEPDEIIHTLETGGTQNNPTPVTASTSNLSDGWWIVPENQIINSTRGFTVYGDVNLILADGSHLIVNGIYVISGYSLTITTPDQSVGTGKLIATASGWGSAGIGGSWSGNGSNSGTITINGGIVEAKGGVDGAGIGGSGYVNNGTVVINGGSVTAIGGTNAAGIGGGVGGNGGTVTINGGSVTAIGGTNATGIGGGTGGNSGMFTMNGNGVVFASSVGDTVLSRKTGGLLTTNNMNNGITQWLSGNATSFTIANGRTVVVPQNFTLTVGNGQTLTNNGIIINNGVIQNNGTIINNGEIISDGEIRGSPIGGSIRPPLIIVNTSGSGGSTYVDDILTITQNGNYTISMVNVATTTRHRIAVNNNINATITLKNVNIAGLGTNQSALTLGSGTSVTLILEGANSLIGATGGVGGAGIFVPGRFAQGISANATLTINGTGSLTARGNGRGAGIGGRHHSDTDSTATNGGNSGNITINNGNITASASGFGAGIGAGWVGNSEAITINGGTVHATGGNGAAGIGNGVCVAANSSGAVTITGGTITAIAGNHVEGLGQGVAIGKGNLGNSGTRTVIGTHWNHWTNIWNNEPTWPWQDPEIGTLVITDYMRYIRLSDAVIVSETEIKGVTPPRTGEIPTTTIPNTTQYTGTVTWTPSVVDTFKVSTVYIATITLTVVDNPKYTFEGARGFTVPGASFVSFMSSDPNIGVITAVFPRTTAIPVSGIALNHKDITLLSGSSRTLTANVTPNNASNRNVKWSSSNPAVANVNNSGVISAIAPGNTLITATTEDGGLTARCSVTVIAPTLSFNRSFVFLEKGRDITLAVTSNATNIPGYNDVTKGLIWESLCKGRVANVDNNGKVSAVNEGTTTIRVSNKEFGIATECRVEVIGVAPTADSVKRVEILQNRVTINARNSTPVRIPIRLIFEQTGQQHLQSAIVQSSDIFMQNVGVNQSIVEGVSLLNVADGFFNMGVEDDRFVVLTPTRALANDSIRSLKTKLSVKLVGVTEPLVTNELTFSIVRTNPTVRFTPIRFNSFFPNEPVNVIATTNIGRVTNIELAKSDVISDENNLQESALVTFDKRHRIMWLKEGQRPRRLTFEITVEGFEPFTQNVSVSVRRIKPTTRLSASTVSMYKEAELRVNSNRLIGSIELVPRSRNDNSYNDYSVQLLNDKPNGTFRIIYKDGEHYAGVEKNTRLRLEVRFFGTFGTGEDDQDDSDDEGSLSKNKHSVYLNLTIRKPRDNTAIRLSRNSVTLSNNSSFLNKKIENKAIVRKIPTPVDGTLIGFQTPPEDKDISYGFYWHLVGNAKNYIKIDWDPGYNAEIGLGVLLWIPRDDFATISLKDGIIIPTGTYRAELREVYYGKERRVAGLTVRVVDNAPNIRLLMRGTSNIIDPNSTITLTPRFTNYNWNGGTIEIKDAANSNFTIIPGSETITGAVTLRMKDKDQKDISRQQVTLTYNGIDSIPINITPRQVNPRLQFNNRITLHSLDPYSEGVVNIGVLSPVNASILNEANSVRINGERNNELYSIRRVQDGVYAIGFKDNKIDARIRNGDNVRLDIDLKGAANPVSITVRVVIA